MIVFRKYKKENKVKYCLMKMNTLIYSNIYIVTLTFIPVI